MARGTNLVLGITYEVRLTRKAFRCGLNLYRFAIRESGSINISLRNLFNT
jgi:hypothetical protein